jgi:uncharacterized membrane protein YidH (DUF202 family)
MAEPQVGGEPKEKSSPSAYDLAVERTLLAASRTVYAVVRTGLSIAAGGAVATTLLVQRWPHWVAGLLHGAFVVIGYSLMWGALSRYRALDRRMTAKGYPLQISTRQLTLLTVALQLVLLAVLVLYLLSGSRGAGS